MASRGRSNFSARVKKYRPVADEDGGGDDDYNNEDGFGQNNPTFDFPADTEENESLTKRFAEIEAINGFDEQMGFVHYAAGPARMGWMLNMKSVSNNGCHCAPSYRSSL